MIQLTDHSEGVILPVRAQPGARRSQVVGEWNGSLKVAVTAPPEDGRANNAIVAELVDFFGLKRSQVELIGGLTSRDKKILLRTTRRVVEERIAQFGGT
ncbi:MAG: DUF167 domain-containing protein [Gemmataceae bacterium]